MRLNCSLLREVTLRLQNGKETTVSLRQLAPTGEISEQPEDNQPTTISENSHLETNQTSENPISDSTLDSPIFPSHTVNSPEDTHIPTSDN